MRTGIAILLAVVISLAAMMTTVDAHQPWFNTGSPDPGEPYALRTPLEISQVVYGGFTGPGQVDFYTFTAPDGFQIDINLVTDDDEACAEFRPAFTLIGPGVPATERPIPVPLPEAIPVPTDREGSATIHGGDWEPFYERFAGVTFVRGPAFTGPLAGGEYLVAVFDPDGGEGVYGLTLGGDEVIGGEGEFFTKFVPWTRCQPVRDADPWDPFAVG